MPAHHLPDADGALVVDEKRAWSATEAWDLADRVAHRVREATDGGRRRVAVFAENAGEAVIAHLGGLRSGASVVAVNSHLAAPEVAYQLAVANVALVVAGPQTAEQAHEAAAIMVADGGGQPVVMVWDTPEWGRWLTSAPDGPPSDDRPIRPNLLFTSGTTGRPKAPSCRPTCSRGPDRGPSSSRPPPLTASPGWVVTWWWPRCTTPDRSMRCGPWRLGRRWACSAASTLSGPSK